MNFNSVIQSCKVKLRSNIFEAADNNFDDLNSDHWDKYPITMVTWYCWELWHRLFVYQWYVCRPQHPATRSTGWANDVITSWWSRASWGEFYILVYFLCVGVTFFALERFYHLDWYYSDMRSRDVWRHNLWWSRESWYDFFLRLGWKFRLGGILFVLVSFYTLVQSIESWFYFPSFWTQFSFLWDFISFGVVSYLGMLNCILVCSFFILLSFFVLVWFYLIWCNFISWCD